jgi:hypothetical protein
VPPLGNIELATLLEHSAINQKKKELAADAAGHSNKRPAEKSYYFSTLIQPIANGSNVINANTKKNIFINLSNS